MRFSIPCAPSSPTYYVFHQSRKLIINNFFSAVIVSFGAIPQVILMKVYKDKRDRARKVVMVILLVTVLFYSTLKYMGTIFLDI